MNSIDTQLVGIGEVIKNNHLCVPSYQRSFAWDQDNVIDLLDDIGRAIEKKEAEYFLGSAVLSANHDELEIIDGQQRIATTSILIAAIRNWLMDSELEDTDVRSGILERDFLFDKDLQTLEVRPKLRLNLVDHPFFLAHVIERKDGVTATTESHGRIREALTVASERVEQIVSGRHDKPVHTLMGWIEYIQKSAKIIRVIVPDHANAFTIFETLNDRGRDLAISDLIKNFLFACSKSRMESAQASWIQMTSVLEGLNETSIQVDFIRHAWSARHGLTRERELFKSFKEFVVTPDDACDLARQLEISAMKYAAIISCSAAEWSSYGQGFVNNLLAIRTLGVENVRPLLLAVSEVFGVEKAKKAVEIIKNCVTRATVVGGKRGTYEKHYSDIAKEIYRKALTRPDELKQRLKEIAPTDELFVEAFENLSLTQAKVARYYLRELEKTANPSAGDWDPSSDETTVNLEHVLPKRKGSEWENFDEESHRTYRNRLGNQCLLNAKNNSTLGNTGFEDKVATLKDSCFVTTQWAAESGEWSGEVIRIRQVKLAKLAPQTWPL